MPFAIPDGTTAITAKFTFRDWANKTITKDVVIEPAASLAAQLATLSSIGDAFAAASDCQVEAALRLELAQNPVVPAVAEKPVANTGHLTLALVTDAEHSTTTNTFVIPGLKLSAYQSTTGNAANVIDTSDALITSIVAFFRETGGVATVSDHQSVLDGAAGISGGRRVNKSKD